MAKNKKMKTAQVLLDYEIDQKKLFGQSQGYLRRLEDKIGVKIKAENLAVTILNGDYKQCQTAKRVIKDLVEIVRDGGNISNDLIDGKVAQIMGNGADPNQKRLTPGFNGASLVLKNAQVTPRSERQKEYLTGIFNHTVSFGVGEAGTGKTFLAVAAAIDAFERGAVKKIILCRPAVEAGEKLGFLPGDQKAKVDPYFRPIYDALQELLPHYQSLVNNGQIEIAPLGFMRGRTLKDAFVVLDEAQNTTREQMKMFLTRLGPGSKMVITGDHTQIDLPEGIDQSGLVQALEAQEDTKDIYIHRFTSEDVVRHELVGEMLKGYERLAEKERAAQQAPQPK